MLVSAIHAAPRPLALNLSKPDGTTPRRVAVAAANLLDTHSSPVHPAAQLGAPQPDTTHPQQDPSQPPKPSLPLATHISVAEGVTAKAPSRVQHTTAAPAVQQGATQHHVAALEVLWQIFQYAEAAGMKLTSDAMDTVWTVLATTGNYQLQLADLINLHKADHAFHSLSLPGKSHLPHGGNEMMVVLLQESSPKCCHLLLNGALILVMFWLML